MENTVYYAIKQTCRDEYIHIQVVGCAHTQTFNKADKKIDKYSDGCTDTQV